MVGSEGSSIPRIPHVRFAESSISILGFGNKFTKMIIRGVNWGTTHYLMDANQVEETKQSSPIRMEEHAPSAREKTIDDRRDITVTRGKGIFHCRERIRDERTREPSPTGME